MELNLSNIGREKSQMLSYLIEGCEEASFELIMLGKTKLDPLKDLKTGTTTTVSRGHV